MGVGATHEGAVYWFFIESKYKGVDLGKCSAILMTNKAKVLTKTLPKPINWFDIQNQHSVSHLARYDRFFLGAQTANQSLHRTP